MRQALALMLIACCGCSAIQSIYQQSGYSPQEGTPIKRIAVAAWAPQSSNGLADVLGHVATDLVMLRKNYLVYQTIVPKQSWAEGCVDKAEGVLLIRALASDPREETVYLALSTELYRCSDGAMVWRAEASSQERSTNADLATLVQNYTSSVGDAAKRYAAPAFVLLQQLVRVLPDPKLNDADVEEKIQLGSGPVKSGRDALAARPAQPRPLVSLELPPA